MLDYDLKIANLPPKVCRSPPHFQIRICGSRAKAGMQMGPMLGMIMIQIQNQIHFQKDMKREKMKRPLFHPIGYVENKKNVTADRVSRKTMVKLH